MSPMLPTLEIIDNGVSHLRLYRAPSSFVLILLVIASNNPRVHSIYSLEFDMDHIDERRLVTIHIS